MKNQTEKEEIYKNTFVCISDMKRKTSPLRPTDAAIKHREATLKLELANEQKELECDEVWH